MYEYPFGDTNELNLDWIVAKVKELTDKVEELENRVAELEGE